MLCLVFVAALVPYGVMPLEVTVGPWEVSQQVHAVLVVVEVLALVTLLVELTVSAIVIFVQAVGF